MATYEVKFWLTWESTELCTANIRCLGGIKAAIAAIERIYGDGVNTGIVASACYLRA